MQNVLIDYFDDHDFIKMDEEKRLLIHSAGEKQES
jgi:hypothetical protein